MDEALSQLVWENAGHRCEYCQLHQVVSHPHEKIVALSTTCNCSGLVGGLVGCIAQGEGHRLDVAF